MTLTALQFVLLIAVPMILGAAFLRLFRITPEIGRTTFLAWAFGAGSFVTALAVYGLLLRSTPLPMVRAIIGGAAGALLLIDILMRFFGGRRKKAIADPDGTAAESAEAEAQSAPKSALFTALGAVDRLIFLFAVLFAVYVQIDHALYANEKAVFVSDEATIWSAKAKALAHAGGFNDAFKKAATIENFVQHKDYPLLNPLLQVWTFAVAGRVTAVDQRLMMQFFAIFLCVLTTGALKRRLHGICLLPLFFALAFSKTLWFLVQTAYADHLVAFGFAMALDAWLRFRESGERRFIAAQAIGLAIMVWSKNEGALLLAAIIGASAVGLVIPRLRATVARPVANGASLLLPAGVLLLHQWTNRRFGFTNDLMEHDGRSLFDLVRAQWAERTWIVRRFFVATLFGFWPAEPMNFWVKTPSGPVNAVIERGEALGFGGVLRAMLERNGPEWLQTRFQAFFHVPAAAIAALLAGPRRIAGAHLIVPFMAIVFAILGFFLIYVGSYQEIVWHLFTSSSRVLFDVFPAAVIWLGAALAALFPALGPRRAQRG